LSFLHLRAKSDEAGVRQGQLMSALADQERSTRQDVAQAVAAIEARLVQIGLARRRLEFLEQHREGLRRKEEVAPAAGFEGRKAALEVLAAQQDLFHDVIEWKLAAVKLRELEGELAIECGYTAALDCRAACCP
jgi:outer membrane protein TolC